MKILIKNISNSNNDDMKNILEDEDKYEVIRIENNNCYSKLVYDPKL